MRNKSCQKPLLSHFRKPLNGKARPLKSMGHNQVIQKRCILLPDFIFFIDDTLLHSIFKHWNLEKAHTIKWLRGIGVTISTGGHLETTTPNLLFPFTSNLDTNNQLLFQNVERILTPGSLFFCTLKSIPPAYTKLGNYTDNAIVLQVTAARTCSKMTTRM